MGYQSDLYYLPFPVTHSCFFALGCPIVDANSRGSGQSPALASVGPLYGTNK